MGVSTAISDRITPTVHVATPLTAWYAPGFTDALGDRLLLCDTATSRPLEMLRFTPALADAPQFEAMLRARTHHLEKFHHPAFATVRCVDRVADHTSGVVIVSEHVPGNRLVELMRAARSQGLSPDPALAVWVIHELLTALDELHRAGAGIAHGTISPERIVIASDGRLVITEYVVGPALESLALTSADVWGRFRVAAPHGPGAVHFSAATDIVQVAVTALMVLLGRTLRRDEYPSALASLVNDACTSAGRREDPVLSSLREWLSRALSVDPDGRFRSIRDAYAALPKVSMSVARPVTTPRLDDAEDEPEIEGRQLLGPGGFGSVLAPHHAEVKPSIALLPRDSSRTRRSSWVRNRGVQVAALAVFAVAEAALLAIFVARPSIAGETLRSLKRAAWDGGSPVSPARASVLGMTPPGAGRRGRLRVESDPAGIPLSIDGRAAGTTPIDAELDAGSHVVELAAPSGVIRRPIVVEAGTTTVLLPTVPSTTVPKTLMGWVAVSAPFTVELYIDGNRVGVGRRERVSLAPGRRTIVLVNEELAFRTSREVVVRSGETVQVPVTAPVGSLSVNAVPWAEVWVDGQRVGETPLSAIKVAVGHHEVVFSHPEHGNRRKLVTVLADAEARIGVDLRK